MIEFLASVEPASLPLIAVLAFSASLIPVGLMLGSPCSPCCGCSACTEGSLPSTVTVTLDGFPDTRPGPTLLSVVASSCTSFTPAIGVPRAPSGQGPPGPITSVDVTDGGSNFALLGRVEPQLTITGSGADATFTPTFSISQNVCGIPTWSIESIAVSGGSGYTDEESLVITASDDDTVLEDATAILYLDKAEPTLTLVGSATATVAVAESFDGGWAVDSVTVTSGGSGYTEGDALTFVGGDDTIEVVAASGIAQVEHDEPIPTVFIDSPGGINAVLTPVWEVLPSSAWPAPHKKTYRLASVTVDNGGSDYQQFEQITILLQDVNNGQVLEQAFIDIDSVDGNGAIQAIFVAPNDNNFNPGPAGRYVGSRTDKLDSIAITNGGNYYDDVPGSITVRVITQGEYYREDPDESPYVSEVSISLIQTAPSDGDGATFEAVIDTDTTSETFGQITAFTVTNGGDGYLEFGDILLCCGEFYNGRTFVLKRSNTDRLPLESNFGTQQPQSACVFQHRFCGVHNQYDRRGIVRVTYSGSGSPPTVEVVSESSTTVSSGRGASFCGEVMTADSTVSDCDDFQFTASNDSGATATVQPGGDYDPDDGYAGERSCFICCKGADQPPEEITVSWAKNNFSTIPNGNYVLPRGVRLLSLDGIQLLRAWNDSGTFSDFGLAVAIRPCSNEQPIGSGYAPIVLNGDAICDECHRSCITYALVDEDLGAKSLSLDTATCSDCEETPVCSPTPGAYETALGTLTIS